jgi:hypothetical protein
MTSQLALVDLPEERLAIHTAIATLTWFLAWCSPKDRNRAQMNAARMETAFS